MITDLFFLVLGAFIGWVVPAPKWAIRVIDKVKTQF